MAIYLVLFIVCIIKFPILSGVGSFLSMYFIKGKISYVLLFCFVILFSGITLFFVPQYSDDMYRYYEVMKRLSTIPNLSEFLKFSAVDSTLQYQGTNKLFNLMEFFVAKTGYPSLLPYFGTVICYFCICFPIVNLKVRKELSSGISFFLSLLTLLLFHIFFTANTIRWALACSVFFL